MKLDLSKADFLEYVFQIPPTELIEWNRFRDKNEKKLFIRFIDALYSFYKSDTKSGAKVDVLSREDSIQDDLRPADENSVTVPQSSLKGASNATSVSFWIRQNPKQFSSSRTVHDTQNGSSTTGSSFTHFSNLSKTTIASMHDLPGMYKRNFYRHKRAGAVNQRSWNTEAVNEFQGYFDLCQEKPAMRAVSSDTKHNVNRHIFTDVINSNLVDWVLRFFSIHPSATIHSYLNVIRGLQSHRRMGHYDTMRSRHFSVEEDSRFYKPSRFNRTQFEWDSAC
jgi:hypothetical protein